jgi:Putative oxalocrotonate tautomerase enzyme
VEFVDLPKFYVVVRFDEYPVDSMWLGGEPANDFVRFVVDHIARQMDDPAFRELCMTVVCDRLAPFTTARGLRTEIHIDETAMDLWRVNGLKPPPPFSEAEKQWAIDNAPTAYDLAEA